MDPQIIATCYNTVRPEGDCIMKSAIWRLSEQSQSPTEEIQPLQLISELDTVGQGEQIKVNVWNSNADSRLNIQQNLIKY